MWKGLPIVIFGTSGFAQETLCVIEDINKQNYINQFDFLGFVGENIDDIGKNIGKYKVVATDDTFEKFIENYTQIGVVVSIASHKIKSKIYNKLSNYSKIIFPNIVSPYCKIGDLTTVKLGIGNIITAGCTLTCNINIGNFNIININSTIGHDCLIDDFCVINPLSSISGNVHICKNVLIGAGASIMQGITINDNSNIGLGAFIVKDVEQESTMICSPAKKML